MDPLDKLSIFKICMLAAGIIIIGTVCKNNNLTTLGSSARYTVTRELTACRINHRRPLQQSGPVVAEVAATSSIIAVVVVVSTLSVTTAAGQQ